MATDVKLATGFNMPSWTYKDQEPLDIIGAASRGIDISNKFMDQPNIKRGRKVQAMQQDKVLSGEMPITTAQAGPDGMVTGKFQDQLTYDLDRSLDKSKIAESEASAAYRAAQAANVGATNQSIIDLNNARAQAALGGGIFGAGENGEEVEMIQVPDGNGGYTEQAFVRRKSGLYPVTIPKGAAGGEDLTKGQEALDKAYAKDYAEFATQGGSANLEKQIKAVEDSIATLGEVDTASGPIVGNLPDAARKTFFPKGAAAQADIEGAVQQTLRQTLGAQFTEKEGERLLARTFDPRAPETENVRRAQNVLTQLKGMASAKADAAKYFEENGTMTGYKGKLPSFSDLDPDASAQAPKETTAPKAPPVAPPKTAPVAPAQSTAIPAPAQRVPGTVYQTPKGPMTWTGTGWTP